MPTRALNAAQETDISVEDFGIDWTPEKGSILSFPAQTLRLEALKHFQYVFSQASENAKNHDLSQQQNYMNLTELGLVKITDETYGEVWATPEAELEDFGTPYLIWNVPHYNLRNNIERLHGEWVLKLAGIQNEGLATVEKTRWDNKKEIKKLAQNCSDQELILVMLAMENPESVRTETERWKQEQTARETARTVTSRTTHVPYTKIAKILKDDPNCRSGHGRTRITALQLPNSRISPCVLIDIPREQLREATFNRLNQEGYFRVNVELKNPRVRSTSNTDERYTVWGKDHELFNKPNPLLLDWIAAKADTFVRSWHKPKQSAIV